MKEDKDVLNFVGTKIKREREKRGLSQREFASDLDISQQTIARYENGTRKADIIKLYNMAKYFNINMNSLFPYIAPDSENIIYEIPVLDSNNITKDYINVPTDMKDYIAYEMDDDSMFPKYLKDDTILFKKYNKKTNIKDKDVLIKVNDKIMLRRMLTNDEGIVLLPYNIEKYDMIMYSKYNVKDRIEVLGIAVEKRSKI